MNYVKRNFDAGKMMRKLAGTKANYFCFHKRLY